MPSRRAPAPVAVTPLRLIPALALLGCGPLPPSTGELHTAAPAGMPMVRGPMDTPTTVHDLPPQALAALGTWYLTDAGERRTLYVGCAEGGYCGGTVEDPATGARYPLDSLAWLSPRGELALRYVAAGVAHYLRLRVEDGVALGRSLARVESLPAPAEGRELIDHVTGWRAESFAALAPRVYRLTVDDGDLVTLRIDHRAGAADGDPSAFVARVKVYGSRTRGADDEADEYDASVLRWDGVTLDVAVDSPAWPRSFHGTTDGRLIAGEVAVPGGEITLPWKGERAELLTHGFSPIAPAERAAWQKSTRSMVELLMMAGNPAPSGVTVQVLRSDVAPTLSRAPLPDRDDDPANHPADYRMTELLWDVTLPDPYAPGGPPLSRRIHGYLAMPVGEPPMGGRPAVLAVNGHTGSAAAMMDPDSEYFWYGDAYARRGYAVLAIDIGHRPVFERRGLYDNFVDGDDPAGGNGTHAAIASPGMDSDWTDDGERVWDVMRALDWLVLQPGIDARRVAVSGLSMGGEITTFAAALDPRFALAVPAGFSPDLSTLLWRGSHGCWRWLDADISEYLDTSDLHALIAPRPLVVETGKNDVVYSLRKDAPFAGDKQVMRRSRSAWSDAPERLLHYLHYDVHHFHVGAENPVMEGEHHVRVPERGEPESPDDAAWQSDPTTVDTGEDLFDLIARLLG